jgi:ABC-type branched-subunit amino acid transport system ATPase component
MATSQFLYLSRAIVRKSKILILDEGEFLSPNLQFISFVETATSAIGNPLSIPAQLVL